MSPSFSQMMDTEVDTVKTQSNLAGEPWATIKSLGGLVNAVGERNEDTRGLLCYMGVSCDDIINL